MVDQDTLQSVLFNLNLLVEKVINLEYKFDVLNKQIKSKQNRRRSSAEAERNNAVVIPDTRPENTDIRNCLEININPVPPTQQNEELLAIQLEETKANLEGMVDERDFYFGKLRDIEIFCQIQEPNPTLLKILDILYATESKSLKPSLAPRRFPYSPPPEDTNVPTLSSNGERRSLEMEDILLPRETREEENLVEGPPPPDPDDEDVQPNTNDDENETDYND